MRTIPTDEERTVTETTLNRRTMMKAGGGAAIAAAANRAMPALAQDASTPAGSVAGELVIGKGVEAVGWDPAVTTAAASFEVLSQIYENLVAFDDNGDPQPQLAESWEIVDDLTYVFTLRTGIAFHNGQPLTADDVVHTFTRLKDEATASPRASQFADVDTIEATDPQTVTFTLTAPNGPFLATLAANFSGIVPQTDPPTDYQTTPIGTGPFMLQEFAPDTQTILAANPNYWQQGMPQLATLRYTILPDESGRLAAIRTGDVHLTSLTDPVSVDAARESDGVNIVEQETTDYYLLGLNCKQAPFDNPKVRQAISLGVDRQAIVDAIFFGKGQVTGPIVPTLGDWALPIDQLPRYSRDVDGAKTLLEEAGVSDLQFTVVVGNLYAEFEGIALVIKDQLSEIGVTMDLEPVEWGTFIERWRNRDFQAFVSFNSSGNDPDLALFAAFTTDGSTNAFQFSDSEVDRLLKAGRTTTTPEERKTFYQEAEISIAEQAPAIFISTRYASYATRSNVSGFAPSASQTWDTLAQTTVS